ncbi:hypothetical protein RRF57_005563 [Xylaria bambusicola]|uniref:Ricin B lectin domain-containing protein n=1 Tax=Xylaria bambusicola TaxID=326684 RepID=A0AAN7UI43_9PEZI
MESRPLEELRISQGGATDSQSADSDDSSTIYTPTHTTEPDNNSSASSTHKGSNACAPIAGKTYMICHRESGKVISLKYGTLVTEIPNQLCGCFWKCLEKDGWLGFRETGSGHVLGHDGKGSYRATQNHHKYWEYLQVVPKGNEGYQLGSPRWSTLQLVGIGGDGRTLVDATSSDNAAFWEFTEV